MVSPYILYPQLSTTPGSPTTYNVGMAETFSWVPIIGAQRPLYARASYITNFSDMSIYLSASELSIGAVTIKDNNSGLNADVVSIPGYGSGLQVLTQDLESTIDDITIGDKEGHYANVVPHLSALQVTVTNLNDSANLDAFGRLRISNPLSLFDYKAIYDDGTFFWNKQSSDATDVFQANDASRVFTLTASGGFLVKETYRRFGYQPGKSQMCMFTGILSAQANVIKRSGMFRSLSGNNYTDSTIGIYFQAYDNGSMTDNEKYVWVINNNSNFVPSQSATQAQWNLDKMDGSGPSGIDLDFSKAQIFLFDFEWLGVGRVRCGFNVNGKTYYCHEFLNANNINGTYMIDPNLPVRQEIRSTGGTGSMKTICCSVMSEGGTDSPAYVTRSVSLSSSITPANNDRRGLLGIRLRPDRLDATNEIVGVEVFPQINQQNTFAPFKWELVLRPTPAQGVNWVNYGQSGSMQYAYGSSTLQISGGTVVASGFGNRDLKIELNDPLYNKCVRLGRDLNMISDELWIVMTYFTDNQATWASMTWGEAD